MAEILRKLDIEQQREKNNPYLRKELCPSLQYIKNETQISNHLSLTTGFT